MVLILSDQLCFSADFLKIWPSISFQVIKTCVHAFGISYLSTVSSSSLSGISDTYIASSEYYKQNDFPN